MDLKLYICEERIFDAEKSQFSVACRIYDSDKANPDEGCLSEWVEVFQEGSETKVLAEVTKIATGAISAINQQLRCFSLMKTRVDIAFGMLRSPLEEDPILKTQMNEVQAELIVLCDAYKELLQTMNIFQVGIDDIDQHWIVDKSLVVELIRQDDLIRF